MTERSFDVVVLGAGPAGEVLAGRLGEHGTSVAIVERHLIGGDCSYYACMPSKALLRPQELLREVHRVPGVREAVRGDLDAEAVLRRRDEVIHDLDDEVQLPWLERRDVTVVRGEGRLAGERRVAVAGDVLVARKAVVVATGSAPLVPPIPGLREARPWTNIELTTARRVPGRLIVLGGGVAGVEMAQAWASLGSEVSLVEALPRVLAREEPFASEEVAAALAEMGVRVRTGVKAAAAARSGEGVRLTLEDGATLAGDEVFVAIGRRPATDDIGLGAIGLAPGQPIEVDEHLRSPGHPWLYAVGDANGRVLLTHMGKYQGRVAADHILGDAGSRIDPAADGARSPRVVFTDPQVAAVGYTLASAQEAGLRVRCVERPTAASAGASFYGRNAPGTARLVVDEDRGVIVGATFTGPEIAEMVHAATVAVVGEVPLARLRHAVPSFPTRSEVWLGLLEDCGL